MTVALLAIACFIAALVLEAILIASLLRRVADALDAQNAHYGIPSTPATEVTPHG